MAWIHWLGLGLGLCALGVVALNVYGARSWASSTRDLISRLEAARVTGAPARYDARELDGLPAPVRRYFQTVLEPGQPLIAAVTLEHEGSFNMGEQVDRWRPFGSRQRVVTQRPGFVWDARVMLMPGLPVRVHDACVAGEGRLRAALLGLVTLVDLRGRGELAQGELMRFLAEAPWYPTALLPSQGVRWQAVDDRSAQATLSDGALAVTLLFRFDAQGLIESVLAQARARTVGLRTVMTPWEGRWSNYQERNGMRVPINGEVAWLTPQGRKLYWRGALTTIGHDPAR